MTTSTPDQPEQFGQAQQPAAQPPAPQQPVAPQQPPVPPQQPYAQQPPVPPQQPPAQPYAQQPQPGAPSVSANLQLNYWLSVFFFWIPALIFFLTEKGKSEQLDRFNRDNLNFSLVRTGLVLASVLLGGIPLLGFLVVAVASVGGVVLFVFHLIAAIKVQENFDRGEAPGFFFNVPFVK